MSDLVQKGKLQKWETKKCMCYYHTHTPTENHLQYMDTQGVFCFLFFFKGRKTAEEPRIVPKSLRLRGLGSEPLCGPHNYQGDYTLVHQGWGSHWQVHQPCDGLLQERDPAHCCDLFSLQSSFQNHQLSSEALLSRLEH